MEEIINKVCNRLVSNPHVIGIIANCDMFIDEIKQEQDMRHVDLCIISKEAGNQKTIYMEDGFVVCLRWRTEEQFLDLFKKNPPKASDKRILYDRIGLLQSTFMQLAV